MRCDLILYRMPDEHHGMTTKACFVLSLNGIPLIKTSQEFPWSRHSPEAFAPDDLYSLAQALEKALSVECVYRDIRIKPPQVTLRGGGTTIRGV